MSTIPSDKLPAGRFNDEAVAKMALSSERSAPAMPPQNSAAPSGTTDKVAEHVDSDQNHHEKMVEGHVFAHDMGDDDDEDFLQPGHIKNPYLEALFGFGVRIGPVIRYEVGIALLSLLIALLGFIWRGACTDETAVRTSCSVFGTHIGDWLRFVALSLFISIPGRLLDKVFFAFVAWVSENVLTWSLLDQFFFWVGSLEGSIARFWWIGITWSYADMVTPAATAAGATPPIQDAMRALWVMQVLAVLRNIALRLLLRNVLIGSFEQAINDVLFQQAALLSVCNPGHRLAPDGKIRVDKDAPYREIWRMLSATDVRRKLDFVNKTRFRLYARNGALVPIARKEGAAPFAKLAFKRLLRLPTSALVEVDVRSKEQITAGLYEPSLAASAAAAVSGDALLRGGSSDSATAQPSWYPNGVGVGAGMGPFSGGIASSASGLPGAYTVDMSGFGSQLGDVTGSVVWNPAAGAGAGLAATAAGLGPGGSFIPSRLTAGAVIREEDAADAAGGGVLTGCTVGDDTTRSYAPDASASTGPESTPYSRADIGGSSSNSTATSPQRPGMRRATSIGFAGSSAGGGSASRPTLTGSHGHRASLAVVPVSAVSGASSAAAASQIDDGGYRPLEANAGGTSLVARARERANTALTAIVSAASTTLSGFSASGGAGSSESARDASPVAAIGATGPLRSAGSFRGSIAAGARSSEISRANSNAVDPASARFAGPATIAPTDAAQATGSLPLAGISRSSTGGSAAAVASSLARAPSAGIAAGVQQPGVSVTPAKTTTAAVASSTPAQQAGQPAGYGNPPAPYFPAGYSMPEETRLQSALAARILARTSPAPGPGPVPGLSTGLAPAPGTFSSSGLPAFAPALPNTSLSGSALATAATAAASTALERQAVAPQQQQQQQLEQQSLASLMTVRGAQPRSRSLTAFTFVPPGKEGAVALAPSASSGAAAGGSTAPTGAVPQLATVAEVHAGKPALAAPAAAGPSQPQQSLAARPNAAALFAAHAAMRPNGVPCAGPSEDDSVGLLLTDGDTGGDTNVSAAGGAAPPDYLNRQLSGRGNTSGSGAAAVAAGGAAVGSAARARARSGSEGLRRTRSASDSEFINGSTGANAAATSDARAAVSGSAVTGGANAAFAGTGAPFSDRSGLLAHGSLHFTGATGAPSVGSGGSFVAESSASVGRGSAAAASVSSLGRLSWLRFRPRASDRDAGGHHNGGAVAAPAGGAPVHGMRPSASASALDDLAARAGSSQAHPLDGSRAPTPNGAPARPAIASGGWLSRHPEVSALGTFGRQVGAFFKDAVKAAMTLDGADGQGGPDDEEEGDVTPAAAAAANAGASATDNNGGALHTASHASMRGQSQSLSRRHGSRGHSDVHGLVPTPGSTLSSVPPQAGAAARRGSLPQAWAPSDGTMLQERISSAPAVVSSMRRRGGVPGMQPEAATAQQGSSSNRATSASAALPSASSMSAAVGVAGASSDTLAAGGAPGTVRRQRSQEVATGASGDDLPPSPPAGGDANTAGAAALPPPAPLRKRKKIYPKLSIAHFAAVVDPRNLDPERVFALFDSNADMAVSLDEFIESVETLWVNLRSVKASISGHQSVSTALNALLNTLFWVTVLLSTLFIFDIPVLQVLVPLGTVLVSASFAIGSSISAVVSSLIFVLVTRPYNVGDRVTCSGVFNGEETL